VSRSILLRILTLKHIDVNFNTEDGPSMKGLGGLN
jgi:hypothetical protein